MTLWVIENFPVTQKILTLPRAYGGASIPVRMRSERGKLIYAALLARCMLKALWDVFNMEGLQNSVTATCSPARTFKAVLVNFKKMKTAPDTPTNGGKGALVAGVRASVFSSIMYSTLDLLPFYICHA